MDLIDQDDELRPSRERELTLSTGTILGIFCALLLLCGVFFGFGYNMGSKARLTAQATDPGTSAPSANFGSFSKPAAGSFTSSAGRSNAAARTSPAAAATGSSASASNLPAPAPIVRQSAPESDTTERPVARPQPVSITPSSPPPPASRTVTPAPVPPAPATEPGQAGTFLVQVAAVSHQEDAQMLVAALRARGYSVTSHTSTSDSYFHVQVGPFSNRKDADAMRQRLLTDGYNAVIK